MVTLALGEMFHAWVFTSELLGGSDGLPGVMRPDFTLIGIDANDPLTFFFLLHNLVNNNLLYNF